MSRPLAITAVLCGLVAGCGNQQPAPTAAAPAPSERTSAAPAAASSSAPAPPATPAFDVAQAKPAPPPAPFVCEDDVRAAAKASRRIVIGPKTIVTPAARDLGEALRIFDQG